MTNLQNLFSASYNAIPFLMDASVTNDGRNIVTHEYPNKKYRYDEDLGQRLRTFNIKAIVTGEDYLIRRELLRNALNLKGTGILIHPTFGMVFVIPKPYTISEEMTTYGECVFEITFEEVRENIFPVSGDESIASITSLINELAPYLEGFVATMITTSFKKNIIDASDKTIELNDSLQPNKPVATENDALNDFTEKSNSFVNDRYDLIQNPENFGSAIADLLGAYNNLGKSADNSYELNSNIYYYGDDDLEIIPNTVERKERLKNQLVLNDVVNADVLLNLYSNAIQKTYLDDQQLSKIEKDLEEKYQYLVTDSILTTEILQKLANVRIAAKRFFAQLNVNISKVISVEVAKMPLSKLLYSYYEDFENENEILSLNNLYSTCNIEGLIKMLTIS